MASSLRTPTPTRLALAAEVLAEVIDLLARVPAGPHARALRAKADSYKKIIDRWPAIPPTGPQHAALVELVAELRAQVVQALDGDPEHPPSSTTRVAEPPPSSLVARITLKPGPSK